MRFTMTKTTQSNATLAETIKQLDQIVAYFEDENFDLEQGIAKFDEATELIKAVSEQLQGMELKIEEKKKTLETILAE